MVTFDQGRVHVAEEFVACFEELGLASLADVKAFRGELVKGHSGRRDIFRIRAWDASGQDRIVFLKRNWRPHKKDGLASLLRTRSVRSIAREEWENYFALDQSGLQAPGLVAFGEDCGRLWEHFSFIATQCASGQSLDQFLRDSRDARLRRLVFDGMASAIRRMHDTGLATPDLFARHVFFELSNGQPKFCLIDQARMGRTSKVSMRRRARDLAALNISAPLDFVSARERLRFFLVYAGRANKSMAGHILKRTGQVLKRNRAARAAFWGTNAPTGTKK